MDPTELIILLVIAAVAISAARALLDGFKTVAVVILVLIALGGYSFTQLRDDAGTLINKGKEVACPDDAARQLRLKTREHTQLQRQLTRTDLTQDQRTDIAARSAKAKAQIARLKACLN